YAATHELLRKTEVEALNELDELVNELNGCAQEQQQLLQQQTSDLATLMKHAFHTKHSFYDPLLQRLASGDHESGGINGITFDAAKLKGVWRCVEKMHRSSYEG